MSEVYSSQDPLTPREEEQLERLFANPLFFPAAFKNWISDKVRDDVTPQLPFANILKSETLKGELDFLPNVSPTFVEFGVWKSIGGITDIPGPCKAVAFFAGSSYNWEGDYGALGISVNDAEVDGNQVIWYRGLDRRIFGGRAQFVDLPKKEDNSVRVMVQKIGSGDVDFEDLTLAIFRIFQTGS